MPRSTAPTGRPFGSALAATLVLVLGSGSVGASAGPPGDQRLPLAVVWADGAPVVDSLAERPVRPGSPEREHAGPGGAAGPAGPGAGTGRSIYVGTYHRSSAPEDGARRALERAGRTNAPATAPPRLS